MKDSDFIFSHKHYQDIGIKDVYPKTAFCEYCLMQTAMWVLASYFVFWLMNLCHREFVCMAYRMRGLVTTVYKLHIGLPGVMPISHDTRDDLLDSWI